LTAAGQVWVGSYDDNGEMQKLRNATLSTA